MRIHAHPLKYSSRHSRFIRQIRIGFPCQSRVFKGFTVIEVLISLAILSVISVVGVMSLSGFNADHALRSEVLKTLSLLAKARTLTLSAKEGSAYGVHFEERKAVLFKGQSYSAGALGNQEQALNDVVKISAVTLTGGGTAVVFQKLTGATAQSGTITLAAVRDTSKTTVITIAGTGVAHSN